MCGITGILNFRGQPVDREQLREVTDRLAHRGPDGSDQHIDGAIGLGRRFQTDIVQLFQDECVDQVAAPRLVEGSRDSRHGRPISWLQRPMVRHRRPDRGER